MDPSSETVTNESQVGEQVIKTPNHQFYETDETLVLSIFDKDVDAKDAKLSFAPREFTYENNVTGNRLDLRPLKGQIDTEASGFTVRKVKIEVVFKKVVQGRWGQLVGDAPDVLATPSSSLSAPADPPANSFPAAPSQKRLPKNWDKVVSDLDAERPGDDPNAAGDAVVNKFFQDLYGNADDDTKKAMMKSYTESGGTVLSTNWDEVKKEKVGVKPPQGSEHKRWVDG